MASLFDSDEESDQIFTRQEPVRLSVLRDDLPPSIGGRRGLFASQNIPAGSLIVLEWPTLTWDKSLLSLDDGVWTIIKQILQHAPSHRLTAHLHPRHVGDVPVEEFRQVEEKYRELSPALKAELSVVERDEVLRLYLVMQHNGFQSGLYWHLCMINHSCSPNCIKFEPRTGSRGASEVWTTTDVSAGEELLISYVAPLETSYPDTQEYLQSQHGFRCFCRRCNGSEAYFVDATGGDAANDSAANATASAPSTAEEEETVRTGSQIVSNMEANFEGIEQMLHVATQTYRRPPDVEVIEESLETLDLISAQVTQLSAPTDGAMPLPEQETVRLRSRTQRIQCALLSAAIELFDGQRKHVAVARDYARKLVATATKLYGHQRQLLGANHPNLTTTLTDLSNALEFLQRLTAGDAVAATETAQIFADVSQSLAAFPWLAVEQPQDQQEMLKRAGADPAKQLLWKLRRETDRVKDLYMLAKRVPSAVKVLKGPGVVFWGMSAY